MATTPPFDKLRRLRCDRAFKMAQDALPSGRDLASQSTLCRLENLPGMRELVAMGRAMVDLYCASFRQVPKRIVLDIDDTFDAVHAASSFACSMPIMTSTAFSRSWCRPSGRVGQKSAPTCAAWCGRSGAIGRTPGS
jgi:hypothetical protein